MKQIKLLIMDVDGTLTDGKIYIAEGSEFMKAFHVKDGYGIQKIKAYGVIPVIITGRQSEIVKRRCMELGITELYQGISNKKEILDSLLEKFRIKYENVAYIGDDENDLECMRLCGISACPADAVQEVLNTVMYKAHKKGGEGAVREMIDWMIAGLSEDIL